MGSRPHKPTATRDRRPAGRHRAPIAPAGASVGSGRSQGRPAPPRGHRPDGPVERGGRDPGRLGPGRERAAAPRGQGQGEGRGEGSEEGSEGRGEGGEEGSEEGRQGRRRRPRRRPRSRSGARRRRPRGRPRRRRRSRARRARARPGRSGARRRGGQERPTSAVVALAERNNGGTKKARKAKDRAGPRARGVAKPTKGEVRQMDTEEPQPRRSGVGHRRRVGDGGGCRPGLGRPSRRRRRLPGRRAAA